MKTRLSKKLKLNKSTIVNLGKIKGGIRWTDPPDCPSDDENTCKASCLGGNCITRFPTDCPTHCGLTCPKTYCIPSACPTTPCPGC